MRDTRSQNAFEGWVDAGKQAADAVAGACRLAREVVVEADQDTELGEGFIAGVDAAQRVRHGAGRVGDDVGVAGVGLGLSRIEIGNAPHRQARQVGDVMAAGTGDGDRQGADGVGLVDHDQ